MLKLRWCDSSVAVLNFCCRDALAAGTERGAKLRFKPPIEAVNSPRLHLDGVVEANGARLAGTDGDELSVLRVARQRTRL